MDDNNTPPGLRVYCKSLPKIELHAHLTGSISRTTLHEIYVQRSESDATFLSTTTLQDPLTALPAGKVDFDLLTFFPLFTSYTYQLVNSRESVAYSTFAVLRDFQDDGVVYLELRTTPRAFSDTGMTKRQYLETVVGAVRTFLTKKMVTKLIVSVDRGKSLEEAEENINLAIEFKAAGDPIVGVDLCGDPSKGDIAIFAQLFAKAKQHGLKITLHFAEIAHPPQPNELETMLSFRPDRLGHVIHTTPTICEEIVKQNIGVELCISCNLHAKMLPDHTTSTTFADHHFKFWRGQSCPIALCTDDVGVFLSPVSNELFIAGKYFGTCFEELWNISYKAREMIFGSAQDEERINNILLTWRKTHGLRLMNPQWCALSNMFDDAGFAQD